MSDISQEKDIYRAMRERLLPTPPYNLVSLKCNTFASLNIACIHEALAELQLATIVSGVTQARLSACQRIAMQLLLDSCDLDISSFTNKPIQSQKPVESNPGVTIDPNIFKESP